MAQLPRRRAPDLRALAAALALLVAPAAARAELDLAGTWHVLVHYRDAKTANPDAERWEDWLWELSPDGERLRWAEFPIVVFDDESGRFERREGSGQYARVLQFWKPSDAQRANIAAGLAVNERGSLEKTLVRRDGAWTTASRTRPGSVGAVTYEQLWTIEDPAGLPVFRQADRLASESAEPLEGVMELHTEGVLEDGRLLVGRFERDGTRRGSFEMRRAGERKQVPRRTQTLLQRQKFDPEPAAPPTEP